MNAQTLAALKKSLSLIHESRRDFDKILVNLKVPDSQVELMREAYRKSEDASRIIFDVIHAEEIR